MMQKSRLAVKASRDFLFNKPPHKNNAILSSAKSERGTRLIRPPRRKRVILSLSKNLH
jgi:hypothetical protein